MKNALPGQTIGLAFVIVLLTVLYSPADDEPNHADSAGRENGDTKNYPWEQLEGKTYPDTLAEQLKALEKDETVRTYKARREQLASDPYRPLYHISALWWIGDPNGLCHWRDAYHVFYQYDPEGKTKRVHWGHLYSRDLVHWHDLPPALYPDTELHCYSGQTLVEDDRVIAIYHGKESGNSIATATDPLLLNWKKHPDNPVIPNPDVDQYGRPYRVFDPCIWREDDGYYALSGTSIDGFIRERRKTAEHLFYSKDLTHWKYLHPLLIDATFADLGDDGACPNFWPIGRGKHILMAFSHKSGSRYYIGKYDAVSHRFEPEYHAQLKHGISGGHIGTPSATIDRKGRLLVFHHFYEGIRSSESSKRQWYGCMTLPWHVSLQKDDSVAIEPVEEIKTLRFDHQRIDNVQVGPNAEHLFDGLGGKAIEIEVLIDMGTAREAGLYVLRSPDSQERTRISIFNQAHSKQNDSVQLDICESSLRTDLIGQPPERAPFRLSRIDPRSSSGSSRPVRLRIFIDRSIVEVFADNTHCDERWAYPRRMNWIFPLFSRQFVGSRVYPTREDSRGISFFSRGGVAKVISMDVWQMRSIWPELKKGEGE